jgi:hypothetical protein
VCDRTGTVLVLATGVSYLYLKVQYCLFTTYRTYYSSVFRVLNTFWGLGFGDVFTNTLRDCQQLIVFTGTVTGNCIIIIHVPSSEFRSYKSVDVDSTSGITNKPVFIQYYRQHNHL